MVISRFEVFLVNLDPTIGSETKKTRPCLVISPNELNRHLKTVIVAPMTTAGKPWPSRVACTFEARSGHIVLDQIRTIDKSRLVKRLGTIDRRAQSAVLGVLAEMFAR
jgi:mRNA interferase MazF